MAIKTMKKINLVVVGVPLLITLFLVSGCTFPEKTASTNLEIKTIENKVTVFKSAMCGCCEGYIAELKKEGFEVETVIISDMTSVKIDHNIPVNMQSCHTAIVGDYFIEGHVPIEAIKQLLLEKPDVDGIALPRMPAGSPGMPGQKIKPFKVYSILNGNPLEYMTI